jgi:hypothetical protein
LTDDRIGGFGYGLSLSLDDPTWIELDESYIWEPIGSIWKKTLSSNSAKKQQKAKEFLKSWLTEQEYEDLQDGKLIIPSKIFPDRTYKLKGSASQMIEVYTSGILDHKLCIVAKDPRFENDDTVLAKILLLKTNEERFLKIAEKHAINLDSGFGRYFISNVTADTEGLTITWNLAGEVTLRAGNSIQPGQLLTINDNGQVVEYSTYNNNN